MKENGPSNIFDEASRQSRLKKKPLARSQPKPPVTPGEDSEFDDFVKKMDNYRDEIVEKLDSLQKKLGMSIRDIREYLRNPSNFKSFEWDVVQKQRAIMEDQLVRLMGSKGKEKLKKREVQKAGKERKGKTLGSRKKWIPIR